MQNELIPTVNAAVYTGIKYFPMKIITVHECRMLF